MKTPRNVAADLAGSSRTWTVAVGSMVAAVVLHVFPFLEPHAADVAGASAAVVAVALVAVDLWALRGKPKPAMLTALRKSSRLWSVAGGHVLTLIALHFAPFLSTQGAVVEVFAIAAVALALVPLERSARRAVLRREIETRRAARERP